MPQAKRRAASREGMIVLTVALPRDLHRELAIAALDDNTSANEIMRAAIREFLDQRNADRAKRR
ncbi:MAG TPA: ribbon-helix-helix protein, CopG family [Candidatus Binataceae bacterium]|nr:ribbon-helix-helix protein, CopG family [Candidatus Binataceae bacterium]